MFKYNTSTCIVLIAAICAAATAQFAPASSPDLPMGPVAGGEAPSPGGVDCFSALIGLSDCLTFVEGGSNLTKPDPGCCPELSNLVDTQPVCLCQLLGNPGQVGIKVDMNRALKLPSVCNVTTPPVSLCAAIGIPVGELSPTGAPGEAPALTPGAGEAAAAPSTGGGINESPINLASKHHFLIGFALLFFTYLF